MLIETIFFVHNSFFTVVFKNWFVCYNLSNRGFMVINEQVGPGKKFSFTVQEGGGAQQRLDVYLSSIFVRYSRSFLKRLIDDGLVFVDDKKVKGGHLLKAGEVISITFPSLPEAKNLKAFDKDVGVEVIAQEPDFLIIYKPAGLIVHKPNKYSQELTLVDWLLASYKELSSVGVEDRPGIVHRLDKDTSGLLIIPRNNEAHGIFGDLFRAHKVSKVYWAVVKGHPDRSGTIDFSIGRDPVHKNRMTHLPKSGLARDALTHYKVLSYYPDYSLVEVRLITGRTHQIRVHFAAIGHPLIGDIVYGQPSKLIGRQALDAKKISFQYKGNNYLFDSQVPEDMQKLIDQPTI